ncbi:hypothetical protein [Legionella jamestowniensis]|nr:hypothetical protein [Legionella jamestowniensis]SFL76669.1 hypothetical protein SAMN02746073_1789 [Legionella jamestowniensis DSM 19215]
MKNHEKKDHPEIKDIKNICDVSPNTEQTKDVCDVHKKETNRKSEQKKSK